MSSDRSYHFPAIWLLTSVGERYKRVDTVAGAAEILLHEWPPIVGKAYRRALEACLNALQDSGPADAVPDALMRAADEAFACYIRVVGGRKRFEEPQTPVSRAQQAIPKRPRISGF
ncbi:DUF982 domain-containing protein [Rhizobium leguminosarum]